MIYGIFCKYKPLFVFSVIGLAIAPRYAINYITATQMLDTWCSYILYINYILDPIVTDLSKLINQSTALIVQETLGEYSVDTLVQYKQKLQEIIQHCAEIRQQIMQNITAIKRTCPEVFQTTNLAAQVRLAAEILPQSTSICDRLIFLLDAKIAQLDVLAKQAQLLALDAVDAQNVQNVQSVQEVKAKPCFNGHLYLFCSCLVFGICVCVQVYS